MCYWLIVFVMLFVVVVGVVVVNDVFCVWVGDVLIGYIGDMLCVDIGIYVVDVIVSSVVLVDLLLGFGYICSGVLVKSFFDSLVICVDVMVCVVWVFNFFILVINFSFIGVMLFVDVYKLWLCDVFDWFDVVLGNVL